MALERVDFDKEELQLTCLIHGDSGGGKTHFAASFPKPWFLSVNDEKGWETIKNMPRRAFHDPSFRPQVLKLKTIRDLGGDGFKEVAEEVKKGNCQSIVIDSISFYCEMFYNGLVQQAQSTGGTVDTWKVYGAVNDHLRAMRINFHSLGAHVVWLALTKQPDEANKLAVPMLKGQQSVLFPAGCKYVWYMRAEEGPKGTKHFLHTKRYANILARGRDGGRLPNPIEMANYQMIVDYLAQVPDGDFDDRTEEEIAEELAAESGQSIDATGSAIKQSTPAIKQVAPATLKSVPTPQAPIPTPASIRRR